MIAQLRGVVVQKNLADAVIDVNGVGYRVYFSSITLSRLPEEGQPVRVRVRTIVREDALDLFGFLAAAEEEMFLLLTSVSNVGPRLAMTVLSGMEVGDLASAIGQGDLARLRADREEDRDDEAALVGAEEREKPRKRAAVGNRAHSFECSDGVRSSRAAPPPHGRGQPRGRAVRGSPGR